MKHFGSRIRQNIDDLPQPWPHDESETIRRLRQEEDCAIIVLDDDPTGTQTVHGVPVLTQWDDELIQRALADSPPLLFLLTNSRALTASLSEQLHREMGETLKRAAGRTGKRIEIISRSDSTLRGHFPLETDTLAEVWPEQADLVLLMPLFCEGGRLTIDGQHYVRDADQLLPADQTPFAQDLVFGYRSSFMPQWVEEKTAGRIRSQDVVLIPLKVIRQRGPAGVQEIFDRAPIRSVCVADGVTDQDAEVVAAAVAQTKRSILARVAATYVRARGGLAPRNLLSRQELQTDGTGGLTIVGSHVPKTSEQLQTLLKDRSDCLPVELSVAGLLRNNAAVVDEAAERVNQGLSADRDVVLFTSRELVAGRSDDENQQISQIVSAGLVAITHRVTVCPRYFIAKGGITSSDIATRGLGVRQAMVLGAILPGVPVWRLGQEARFPGLPYVVFPGNVGERDALARAVEKLSRS